MIEVRKKHGEGHARGIDGAVQATINNILVRITAKDEKIQDLATQMSSNRARSSVRAVA